ncbi:MAG: DUF3575 domain-containing protein [Muribaculum sp.]|nr:DUF3575 domain-containing protein [Muribaculum sp.]
MHIINLKFKRTGVSVILMLLALLGFNAFAQNAAAPGIPSDEHPMVAVDSDDMAVDSVRIYFRQSKHDLQLDLHNNRHELNRIEDKFKSLLADTLYKITRIEVLGAASPEGSVAFNQGLSERRANTLFSYLSKYTDIPDSLKIFRFLGRDWEGLRRMVAADDNMPYRDETLAAIDEIIMDIRNNPVPRENSVADLKRIRKGVPYRYMYANLFPELRASQLVVWYEKRPNPIYVPFETELMTEAALPALDSISIVELPPLQPEIEEEPRKPFYMDIRTNMLYDALALPNIGVEIYLGKDISLGGNWLYAWWKKDSSSFYWRAYGGELFGRWWFGKKAHRKPLTGHHLGAYAQVYTYDFELGGTGEIGGKPGGTLWDRCMWGLGLEYGYSLPIGKHLNIDFSLGVGYTTGLYEKYEPKDGHYVWQSTHRRHYLGPTKAEVALVWLIGHGNVNKRKEVRDEQ